MRSDNVRVVELIATKIRRISRYRRRRFGRRTLGWAGGRASERVSTGFSVAKQYNVVSGELWAVEFLTERSGAGLIDIAVHRRIDVIPGAIVPNPGTAARALGQ